MKIAPGSICRTTTGLNMRVSPGGAIVATLVAGALVEALGNPVNGWVLAVTRGWTQDGTTIYFEPDVRSGKKASVRGGGGWRFVEVHGAVAVEYLTVIDGPA
jgi:hypothetical protein